MGLGRPEAMAAGMPIISTTNVEAARFYVEHGMNGVFVDQTADSITAALARTAVRPRNCCAAWANAARTSALRGQRRRHRRADAHRVFLYGHRPP